jgi:hypothetical protein
MDWPAFDFTNLKAGEDLDISSGHVLTELLTPLHPSILLDIRRDPTW